MGQTTIRRFAVGAALALFGAVGDCAEAGMTLRFSFTGRVGDVQDGINLDFNNTVAVGTLVTGEFSYDAGAAVTSSGPGYAIRAGAPVAFAVNVGGGLLAYEVTAAAAGFASGIGVNNTASDDAFQFYMGESSPANLTLPAGATTSMAFAFVAQLALRDNTGTIFGSTDLPTALDLSDFTYKSLRLLGGQPMPGGGLSNAGVISIDIESLSPMVTSVPEPSTLISGGLAALAGLGLAWRRRHVASAA